MTPINRIWCHLTGRGEVAAGAGVGAGWGGEQGWEGGEGRGEDGVRREGRNWTKKLSRWRHDVAAMKQRLLLLLLHHIFYCRPDSYCIILSYFARGVTIIDTSWADQATKIAISVKLKNQTIPQEKWKVGFLVLFSTRVPPTGKKQVSTHTTISSSGFVTYKQCIKKRNHLKTNRNKQFSLKIITITGILSFPLFLWRHDWSGVCFPTFHFFSCSHAV